MYCNKCEHQYNDDSKFCIKCGQPLVSIVPPNATQKTFVNPNRKRKLITIILLSTFTLAAVILILMFSANPIAGRWYSQNGTELIMLKNGKGMTVHDESEKAERIHFMYAIEYQESGYIEGEIYEKENSNNTWFYMYDGILEVNGEYFYRHKPSYPTK